MRPLCLVPLLLLGACAAHVGRDDLMFVQGSVLGLDRPEHARVEVYRVQTGGVPVRMPGAEAVPDATGHFRLAALVADRYLLALRAPGLPASTTDVPPVRAPHVVLRAREPVGRGGALEVRLATPSGAPLRIVVSREGDVTRVVDRREAAVRGDVSALVRGLAPGRWRLDLVGAGDTTEVEIPDTGETRVLVLEPPPFVPPETASVKGRILRLDGTPAPGLAVTIRPLVDGDAHATPWGRYGLTDSDGGYHIGRVPAGRALVRVECREGVYPGLPIPEAMTIPPSGVIERSFVVGP